MVLILFAMQLIVTGLGLGLVVMLLIAVLHDNQLHFYKSSRAPKKKKPAEPRSVIVTELSHLLRPAPRYKTK